MRMAIAKANSLDVPLVVAGDLHDTKANLRGECVNAMLETFKLAEQMPIILTGNHDKINEKSVDNSLNFLSPYGHMRGSPTFDYDLGWGLMPYQDDPAYFKRCCTSQICGMQFIAHQGLQSSNSGDYFQDKSAIRPENVKGLRIISGHYHTRQTIALPDGGQWDYIGNPYTLTFGEANDPEKGFQILMSDGSLQFVPTNLRRHRIFELDLTGIHAFQPPTNMHPDDIIRVKITGLREQLVQINKNQLLAALRLPASAQLELIPLDSSIDTAGVSVKACNGNLLDEVINSMQNISVEQKVRLKNLWRSIT